MHSGNSDLRSQGKLGIPSNQNNVSIPFHGQPDELRPTSAQIDKAPPDDAASAGGAIRVARETPNVKTDEQVQPRVEQPDAYEAAQQPAD